MTEFAALPPEVNSSLMYAGSGAGALLEAAEAWDDLAESLTTSATEYNSVLGSLHGAWSGPSATAMQSSATRYLSWMTETATRAELSATQARAASAAYAAAKAATVPPTMVTANRTMLATLVATNFLGVNTAPIAAAEAEYAEMWAQDAAAMAGYQAASAAATSALPQFTAAPNTTNPVSTAPQTAQPAASITSILDALFGNGTTLGQNWQAFVSSGTFTQLPADMLMGLLALLTADTVVVEQQTAAQLTARPPAVITPPRAGWNVPPSRSPMQARAATAPRIGQLSVPPGWATRPESSSAARIQALPAQGRFQTGIPVPPAVPVMAGGRSSQGGSRPAPEYGAVPKVIPARHPSAG